MFPSLNKHEKYVSAEDAKWAAHSRQPEMCQMLISNGLGATVDEIDDRYGE